jgi:hypothetical protein
MGNGTPLPVVFIPEDHGQASTLAHATQNSRIAHGRLRTRELAAKDTKEGGHQRAHFFGETSRMKGGALVNSGI